MRKLVGLNYQIAHISGVLSISAEFLSRPNCVSNTTTAALEFAPTAPSSNTHKISNVISINTQDVRISNNWAEKQDLDRELALVKRNVKTNNHSTEFTGLKNYDLWKKNRFCRSLSGTNEVTYKNLRIVPCFFDSWSFWLFNSISSKFYCPKMKIEV